MSIFSFIRDLLFLGMTRSLLKSSRHERSRLGACVPIASREAYDDLCDVDSIRERIDELDIMQSRYDNSYGRRRFTYDEADMIHDHLDMDDFEDDADLLEDDLDLFEDDDLDDDRSLFSDDLDPYANDDFSDSFDGDDGDFDI